MIDEVIELHVGVQENIQGHDVVYAGMVSKEVFSIAHLFNPISDNGYGYNLFFQAGAKDINIRKSVFEVVKVDPEYLRLRYKGEDKKL